MTVGMDANGAVIPDPKVEAVPPEPEREASPVSRAAVPVPVNAGLSLAERTRALVARFDAEPKGYAFDDGGEGTTYAQWFADLLDEWQTGEVTAGSHGARDSGDLPAVSPAFRDIDVVTVDGWTRRLWATSQHDRMIIRLAGEIQAVVDEIRQAAGLEELG